MAFEEKNLMYEPGTRGTGGRVSYWTKDDAKAEVNGQNYFKSEVLKGFISAQEIDTGEGIRIEVQATDADYSARFVLDTGTGRIQPHATKAFEISS